jgi:hypothetical protein
VAGAFEQDRMPRCSLLVLLVLLLTAAPAHAAAGLEIGIEDERLLLSDTAEAPAVVGAWRDIGVDVVRLHASWSRIAPPGRRPPAGFAPRDPSDPRYSFAALDEAIRLVRGAGMRVMLTVTGPGPLWTSRQPRRGRRSWRPDPRRFAAFATAVARRYRSQVDRYLIWNEPNLSLSPIREAPDVYRALVRRAAPAIRAADPGAEIVIGELAPLGGEGRMAPLTFLRGLACVDARYRPRRDRACRGFRPLRADALGYHPHSRRRPPDQRSPLRSSAQFGDLGRLLKVTDRLTRLGRLRSPSGRLPLRLTEFGYQTRPPDRGIGVTLARQAGYLQLAAYMAWRNPRVLTLTQYQWRDERVRYAGPGTKAFAGWQSGLHFLDGRPKPSLRAFKHPLVAVRGVSSTRLWGQVRPGGAHLVEVEYRPSVWADWRRVADVGTDETGVFSWSVRGRLPRGAYRFAVRGPDATARGVSGAVTVTRREPGRRARVVAARVSSYSG